MPAGDNACLYFLGGNLQFYLCLFLFGMLVSHLWLSGSPRVPTPGFWTLRVLQWSGAGRVASFPPWVMPCASATRPPPSPGHHSVYVVSTCLPPFSFAVFSVKTENLSAVLVTPCMWGHRCGEDPAASVSFALGTEQSPRWASVD